MHGSRSRRPPRSAGSRECPSCPSHPRRRPSTPCRQPIGARRPARVASSGGPRLPRCPRHRSGRPAAAHRVLRDARRRASIRRRAGTAPCSPIRRASCRPPACSWWWRRTMASVGCGGFRMLDATRAEVKHLYLRDAVRGRGWGGLLLAELEAAGGRLRRDRGRARHERRPRGGRAALPRARLRRDRALQRQPERDPLVPQAALSRGPRIIAAPQQVSTAARPAGRCAARAAGGRGRCGSRARAASPSAPG